MRHCAQSHPPFSSPVLSLWLVEQLTHTHTRGKIPTCHMSLSSPSLPLPRTFRLSLTATLFYIASNHLLLPVIVWNIHLICLFSEDLLFVSSSPHPTPLSTWRHSVMETLTNSLFSHQRVRCFFRFRFPLGVTQVVTQVRLLQQYLHQRTTKLVKWKKIVDTLNYYWWSLQQPGLSVSWVRI